METIQETVESKIFKETWKGKKTVLICEPSIGLIDYQAHESMCDLISILKEYEQQSNYKFFKSCLGRLLVSYAREKFAEYALNTGFDYIMFLDDDHIFPINLFHELEKYLKDYDIVAPLCLQRVHPFYPVIYKTLKNKMEDGRDLYDNEKYVNLKEIRKGDIITDADAIGLGAAIIKVDLLKKMKKPWFFNQVGIGEDIWFTMRAKRDAGAKIVIDTNIECPHLKEREPVFWKDYENSIKEIRKHEQKSIGSNAKPESIIEEQRIVDFKSEQLNPL